MKPRVLEARKDLLARLAPMVTEQDIGRFIGYMDTVKRASAVVTSKGSKAGGISDTNTVERLWRASAGSAHGKRWPSFELQVVVPTGKVAPGQYSTVQHADPDAITQILNLADAVLTYGVMRFADYSGYAPQLTQLIAEASERLAKVIPRRTDI